VGMPIALCMCGCGAPTPIAKRARTTIGHVKGEPLRFVQHHSNWRRPVGLCGYTEVDAGYETPCWLWNGRLYDGYGYVTVNGKFTGAHRWFYEQNVGPVPDEHHLHHLCWNRSCVNFKHCQPVTPAEHVRLSAAANKTHCVNGHEYTPENTYRLGNTRFCRACGRKAAADYRARNAGSL
jgi:hypothetical protein